jgi:hypothetical protein
MKKIILVAIVATLLCNQIWGVWTEIELPIHNYNGKDEQVLKGVGIENIAVAKKADNIYELLTSEVELRGPNLYHKAQLFTIDKDIASGPIRLNIPQPKQNKEISFPPAIKRLTENEGQLKSTLLGDFQKPVIITSSDSRLAAYFSRPAHGSFKFFDNKYYIIKFGKNIDPFMDKFDKPFYNTSINQMRIGSTLQDKQAIAFSTEWPTLRILPIANAPSDTETETETEKEKEFNIMQYSNAYLLDFNQNTLVYAKEMVKSSVSGFFKRISGHGDADIEIKVQFNINLEHWKHPEAGSKRIVKIENIRKKDVFTKIFASAQSNMAAIVERFDEALGISIISPLFETEEYPEGIKFKQIGSAQIKAFFGSNNFSLQKIYLTSDNQKLIMVSQDRIIGFKLQDGVLEYPPAIKMFIPNKDGQALNIQASCMNGDQLFIMHENTDGNKRLFTIDVSELIKGSPASRE